MYDEWCMMSGVWWVVWCMMSGVWWLVSDEWCMMSGAHENRRRCTLGGVLESCLFATKKSCCCPTCQFGWAKFGQPGTSVKDASTWASQPAWYSEPKLLEYVSWIQYIEVPDWYPLKRLMDKNKYNNDLDLLSIILYIICKYININNFQ